MRKLILSLIGAIEQLRDLPPLAFRLTLAYGFFEPAWNKLNHFEGIVSWFANDLGLPFPYLNAVLATTTECLGVLLLPLGLATRLISIPLMVTMIVAILTVHYSNGFACSKNGFEIPFYYFLMLFALLVNGPGRLSVDYFLKRRSKGG